MADNREIASGILSEASRVVSTDRADQHGSAENSFAMIAEFWTTWIRHTLVRRHGVPLDAVKMITLDGADVAQMMALLKKARFMYGNAANPDNFVDDAGYTSLAAMLTGVEVPATAASGDVTIPGQTIHGSFSDVLHEAINGTV